MEIYTPSTNSWAPGPPLPQRRTDVVATSDDYGRIWVTGGTLKGGRLTDSVVVYDPNRPELGWQPKPSLLTPRSSAASVGDADGRIYVMGGFTDETKGMANTMEVYDPATNAWSRGTPFVLPRQAPGAATGADGRIYLVGGSGSNTVEVYDPRTRAWTPGPPMSIDRSGLGVVRGADGRIYAIGGHSNQRGGVEGCWSSPNVTLCTVEVYDPANPLAGWVPVAKMNYLREYLMAATDTSGRIYAMGGQGLRRDAPRLTLMHPQATVEVYPAPAPVTSLPTLSISDASAREGDSAIFAVTLSQASAEPVQVTVKTREDEPRSATEGADYRPTTATLEFPPGVTSASFSVATKTDRKAEQDETFSAVLMTPVNATISDGLAVGTIVNR